MSDALKHLSDEHQCGTTRGWVRRIERSKRKGKTIPMWGAVVSDPQSFLRVAKMRFDHCLN